MKKQAYESALVTRLDPQSAGLQNRRASLMVLKILHSFAWGRHTHRDTARGGGVHETSKVLKSKYVLRIASVSKRLSSDVRDDKYLRMV